MSERKPNILVVGSFVLDQIVETAVIPNEGETVLGRNFKVAPGGKGANQAVQMARLGANVTMIGKVGNDSNGKILLNACSNSGVDTSHVVVDKSIPSGCAIITLLDDGNGGVNNRIIVIPGSNHSICAEDVAFLENNIAKFDMVLLQLEIPMEINEIVAGYAAKANVPVMLNPAPSAKIPEKLLKSVSYISPNETEAVSITNVPKLSDDNNICLDNLSKCARELQKMGVDNVIITLGGNGAFFMGKDEQFVVPAVSCVNVVDPTAAGDSFVGSFCYAKCTGKGNKEAIEFANSVASITVSRMGAMPSLPNREEVSTLFKIADEW